MGTLRDQISMILQLVNPKDEVVVVLNSPGSSLLGCLLLH